ncbi:MAG: heavy-metal-associated domain-containing protein, partial [Aquificaceae bacterium]
RRREMACENGTCEVKNAQRRNKIALWTATGLALLFITFPYIELPSMNVAKEERVRETKEVTLSVKGMTCSACEAEVESAVKKLGGIMQVKADYKKGEVYVKFEEGKTSVDDIVNAINKAGYRARE